MKVFLGFFWLCALFGLCFCIVHAAIWLSKKFTNTQLKKSRFGDLPEHERIRAQQPVNPPTPEPVYFIVEKKSRRKNTYSTPKEIHFK